MRLSRFLCVWIVWNRLFLGDHKGADAGGESTRIGDRGAAEIGGEERRTKAVAGTHRGDDLGLDRRNFHTRTAFFVYRSAVFALGVENEIQIGVGVKKRVDLLFQSVGTKGSIEGEGVQKRFLFLADLEDLRVFKAELHRALVIAMRAQVDIAEDG